MQVKHHKLHILLLMGLFVSSCNGDTQNEYDQIINATDFVKVISFEDELLASPVLITRHGVDKMAILDVGLEEVAVVNSVLNLSFDQTARLAAILPAPRIRDPKNMQKLSKNILLTSVVSG